MLGKVNEHFLGGNHLAIILTTCLSLLSVKRKDTVDMNNVLLISIHTLNMDSQLME